MPLERQISPLEQHMEAAVLGEFGSVEVQGKWFDTDEPSG